MYQRDFAGEVVSSLQAWRLQRSYILWNSVDAARQVNELELLQAVLEKNVNEMKEIMEWHDAL